MTTKEILINFITTSVGLRYWYLSGRRGRYSVTPAKFKDYAFLYGETYSLILTNIQDVITQVKLISKDTTLPANTRTYAKDFAVLLETIAYFSSSPHKSQPSLFEELFAFIRDVIDTRFADLNAYLRAKNIIVTQKFANLCAFNNIVIDPSLIEGYIPPVVKKKPPLIIIQGNFNYNRPESEMRHPLFDLPYVVPYLNWFMDDPTGNPVAVAQGYLAKIIDTRDRFFAANPNRVFQWAFWPQNFGDKKVPLDNPVNNTVFRHDQDKLANGNNFVFTAAGRAANKPYMQTFFRTLSDGLRAAGIPDPLYMDADYESGINIAPDSWDTRRKWHELIMQDPRATTEKIDGVRTYAEYIASLTDLDGNPIPANELFPWIYDGDPVQCKRAHIYTDLTLMVVDYCLWDTLYSPAKEVWPNVKCGNYLVHCATRQNLVNSWRFKETPVDLHTSFHGDYQVPCSYGWSPRDGTGLPVGQGYNTYEECLMRYGVTPANPVDYNADARALNTAYYSYSCKGCQDARPDKPIAFWTSYGYNGDVLIDAQHLPNGGTATLHFDKNLMMDAFKAMYPYNVAAVGFFNPESGSKYDLIYDVVAHLGDAGYDAPSTPSA